MDFFIHRVLNKDISILKEVPSAELITDSGDREKDYLNARNCGSQLTILKYKKEILKYIRDSLDSLNYFDATGLLNTVEYYPNSSNIKDAMIGSAAKREMCIVVTNDKRFSKRLTQYSIPTMEYEEFIKNVKV